MRSTLQAKNAKKYKYFSSLSPPNLNSVISNPSRNSLIDFRCLRPQFLTQRHDANQPNPKASITTVVPPSGVREDGFFRSGLQAKNVNNFSAALRLI